MADYSKPRRQYDENSIIHKSNYRNKDILKLVNTDIYEYDMKDAGFNVIKRFELLPPLIIKGLEGLDKAERNITIGKMRGEDKIFSASLKKFLRETIANFIILNKIREQDILAIRNDAVTFISKAPIALDTINGLYFRKDGFFQVFLNLSGIEFYYNAFDDFLCTKGLSDECIESQNEYWLSFIKSIMKMLYNNAPVANIIRCVNMHRRAYIAKALPLRFYKALQMNSYKILIPSQSGVEVRLKPDPEGCLLESMDIGENYSKVIIPLINLII